MKNVIVNLPVRINFGGGWSDTPPFCLDNGGSVCNAAITINKKKPVCIKISEIEEKSIIIKSVDRNMSIKMKVIPQKIEKSDLFLLEKTTIFNSIEKIELTEGMEIVIDTRMIPRGSGLGTSSILILALLMAIYKFKEINVDDNFMYNKVLYIEKLIGTGGGWQDQAGALHSGIKLINSKPGKVQNLEVEKIEISQQLKNELKNRLVLIYTGQSHVDKNMVQNIMGKYIVGDKKIVQAIMEIKNISVKMREALLNEDINKFSALLTQNYELSCILDKNFSNELTNSILSVCDKYIDGKMICGAGNGGFIEVILKKGVTKEFLNHELRKRFSNSDIKVWNIDILFN